MKTLVTYSTLTGNTKKVAEAIYNAIDGDKEILNVADVVDVSIYDNVIIGYWVDRGDADERAKKLIAKLTGKRVGTFGTLGAYPDTEHAKKSVAKVREQLEVNDNKVLAEFICQGAIDPKIIEMMKKLPAGSGHDVTPERKKRWEDAAKHPDEKDLAEASEVFKNFASL